MKKIVLTGGGSAGHVTPNIALLPALREAGFEITYMGSYDGIEKKLIGDFDLPYRGISTGKFRRYFGKDYIRPISFPGYKRLLGGEEIPERISAGCSLFQRRFCVRTGGTGCGDPWYPVHHP